MGDTNIKATYIADLGCGDKKVLGILRQRLPYDFSYQGYDLMPQEEDVIKIDLNKALPEGHYDLVFCMGLLEYLHDLNRFFCGLQRLTQYAIVSYVASNCSLYTEEDRRAKGWVHNYSASEIVACFSRNGFDELGQRAIHDGKTYIFAMKNAMD